VDIANPVADLVNTINSQVSDIKRIYVNWATLETLQHDALRKVLSERLRDNTKGISSPQSHDPVVLCYAMIGAPMYTINEDTLPGYSNRMVGLFRLAIERSLVSLVVSGMMSTELSDDLLGGRSSTEFQTSVLSNNRLLSTAKSTEAQIEERERRLSMSCTRRDLEFLGSQLLSSHATEWFPSFVIHIHTVCSIGISGISIPHPTPCSHKKVRCLCLANPDITEVCMVCGLDSPCNLILTEGR
jgi:hypothetical protein